DDRIGETRLRVRLGVDLVVRLLRTVGGVRRQIEIGYLLLVESVVRHFLAVGRPPHRGGLAQFFAVDPTRRSVFDPRGVAAVCRQRFFVCAVGVAQEEIPIAIERLQRAVRRGGRGYLTPALRRALAASLGRRLPAAAAQG